jgi:hypothetical protein
MDRDYTFSPELLLLMLSEERQKFITALGHGASWKDLSRIRKTIDQLNKMLDSSAKQRDNNSGFRSTGTGRDRI